MAMPSCRSGHVAALSVRGPSSREARGLAGSTEYTSRAWTGLAVASSLSPARHDNAYPHSHLHQRLSRNMGQGLGTSTRSDRKHAGAAPLPVEVTYGLRPVISSLLAPLQLVWI